MRSILACTAALAAPLFLTLAIAPAPAGAAHHESTDGEVASIDAFRDAIESNLSQLERMPVPLTDARAQVRQKWRAMDAYLREGQVVRIKLYPHQGISRRTEEFYYRDGEVVLAFVEDEGADTRGRSPTRSGKTYYFHDGSLLREVNTTGEAEISAKEADSSRLLQEAEEILRLARAAAGDGHASEHEHHHGDDGHANEHEHHHGDDGHANEHEHHHGDDGHANEHEHHHGDDGHANEHEHHHGAEGSASQQEHHDGDGEPAPAGAARQ